MIELVYKRSSGIRDLLILRKNSAKLEWISSTKWHIQVEHQQCKNGARVKERRTKMNCSEMFTARFKRIKPHELFQSCLTYLWKWMLKLHAQRSKLIKKNTEMQLTYYFYLSSAEYKHGGKFSQKKIWVSALLHLKRK